MAILKANWDQQRDYIANFEPFVADTLKRWPVGEAVKPEALRDRLTSQFSVPSMPINTAEVLRDRAKQDGLIHRGSGRDYFPNQTVLAGVPDLRANAEEVLAHMAALTDAVRIYARDQHGLDWSEHEADQALERFVEEFSVEMATAKRAGGLRDRNGLSDDRALAVVHGFAREALKRQPTHLAYLEEMVKGSMLANVLYFQGLGDWSTRLDRLVVYIDTTVALRILGLAPPPLIEAGKEMLGLVKEFGASPRVFEHTVDEMRGVLEGVANGLRKANLSAQDVSGLSRINREVVDALVQQGWGPADVEEVAADLERNLLRAGIQPAPLPDYPERPDFSEQRLEEMLDEGINYRWKKPRERDAKSIAGTRILRGANRCSSLSLTPAIFVTSNGALARISHRFFREEGIAHAVPPCVTEISLTTQLWVRKPDARPDVARKLLIAESFAALNPNAELWERYLAQIERQRQNDVIDDQRVKLLVYSMESREGFFRVTHGDADAVDEGTPLEVLQEVEKALRQPAEEAAKEAEVVAAAATNEREELRTTVESQQERLEEQGRTIEELSKWQERREKADRDRVDHRKRTRRNVGLILAALLIVAGLALPLLAVIEGALAITGVASGATLLATGVAAWALQKDWRWAVKAFIGIGAVLALPLGLCGVLKEDTDRDPAPLSPPK